MSDTPPSPTPGAGDTPPPQPAPRTEADILADPRLLEFVAGYQPTLHELFLKSYARLVQELHTYGQRYDEQMAYLLRQFEGPAREHFWNIQHKKLFDLQCRWRAGQVVVPGARLTADFDDWHEDIANCGAVPPVAPDELALYDAFLASVENTPDDLEKEGWTHYWFVRRYPEGYIRHEFDWDEILPEWSNFYDQHRGTAGLRNLPDLRGAQEERYLDAWREARWAEREDPAPPDPRPNLPTYGPEFNTLARELLRRYEAPALLRHFEAKQYLEENDANEDSNELERALETLHEAGLEQVPIDAHADWRQAIIGAAHRHRIRQIRRVLPEVYEDYCQREALGIAQPSTRPSWRTRSFNPHAYFDTLAPHIRAGRVLLGEPDDLDF